MTTKKTKKITHIGLFAAFLITIFVLRSFSIKYHIDSYSIKHILDYAKDNLGLLYKLRLDSFSLYNILFLQTLSFISYEVLSAFLYVTIIIILIILFNKFVKPGFIIIFAISFIVLFWKFGIYCFDMKLVHILLLLLTLFFYIYSRNSFAKKAFTVSFLMSALLSKLTYAFIVALIIYFFLQFLMKLKFRQADIELLLNAIAIMLLRLSLSLMFTGNKISFPHTQEMNKITSLVLIVFALIDITVFLFKDKRREYLLTTSIFFASMFFDSTLMLVFALLLNVHLFSSYNKNNLIWKIMLGTFFLVIVANTFVNFRVKNYKEQGIPPLNIASYNNHILSTNNVDTIVKTNNFIAKYKNEIEIIDLIKNLKSKVQAIEFDKDKIRNKDQTIHTLQNSCENLLEYPDFYLCMIK